MAPLSRYNPDRALHRGDKSKRVTVQLPRSFAELSAIAVNSCGMTPPLTLYLNGDVQTTVSNFNSIVDNDVIVVVDDKGRALDLRSVYNSDFVEMPLSQQRYVPPARERAPDTGPFKGTSEYDERFIQHPMTDSPRRRPAAREAPADTGPFKGVSEYDERFTAHPMTESPRRRPAAREAPADTGPFNGVSEYDERYIKHPMMVTPRRHAPSPTPWPQSAPFTATTCAQDSYIKHPPTPRSERRGKLFEEDQHIAETRDFQTESRGNFLAPQPSSLADALTSRRGRTSDLLVPNAPFEGVSESQAMYHAHPLPPPRSVVRAPPPPPSPAFKGLSEYEERYKEWPVQARQSPHREALATPRTKFEGRTNSQDSYVKHDTPRVVRAREQQTPRQEPESRTFETASRSSYVSMPLGAYARRPAANQIIVHIEPEIDQQ